MSISDLKKNRQASIEALNAEIEKHSRKSFDSEPDDRFWYPAVDKAGNGNAIIRFLPPVEGESIPFVRYWVHSFQGPTGIWIVNEMCPTTKGKQCPICALNRELWNSGDEAKRKQASKQKRKLNFVANIQVLKYSADKSQEGQVKLFRFGQKIWDKINEKMHPSVEGEKAVNPFDFWEGVPLTIKIRNVEGYRNYDMSEWGQIGALSKDDEYLDEVWKKEMPLQPFIADELFHTEAEIRTKLSNALGIMDGTKTMLDAIPSTESPFHDDKTIKNLQEARKARSAPAKEEPAVVADDEEMDEDYFKRLASE